MSGFITQSGSNFLLDLLCRAIQAPQEYYVALIANTPPTAFSDGITLDEPTIDSYQRIAYANAPGNWSERTEEMSNTYDIAFPVVGADEVWPSIAYWGILDQDQGGQLLWAGSFADVIELEPGDQIVLPAGSITLRTVNYVTRVSM